MLEHEKRVVEERASLEEKIIKLGKFLSNTEKLQQLTNLDVSLLRQQYRHMVAYADVLRQRIARFNDENA